MGEGERDSREGLGQAWDRWVERVNAPPDPELEHPEPDEDSERLTPRDVVVTAAAFLGMAGALLLLHREPSKRDRLAEKVRELDEPYLRHERTTTVPD